MHERDLHDPMYISAYNSRYINKPKLIVCAGGDEFFMIDDTKFYFQQLLGDKYLRWYITSFKHATISCLAVAYDWLFLFELYFDEDVF